MVSTPHHGIPAPLLSIFHLFPDTGEEDILLMTGTDPQRRRQSRPRVLGAPPQRAKRLYGRRIGRFPQQSDLALKRTDSGLA
jgi:hypothetical protein